MQGQLFTQDFLLRGIRETPPWQMLGEAELAAFSGTLAEIFAALGADTALPIPCRGGSNTATCSQAALSRASDCQH